jgi:predicted chitinase
VYANRGENGDTDSGDGFKYRGRGLIQLTFKEGYRRFTELHNSRYPDDRRDFVAHPELVIEDMKYGVESAFAWWTFHNVNEICTGATPGDVMKVTVRVNGGNKGYEGRLANFNRLVRLLGL